MRRAERSVYKLVSKYIKNEQLRQGLSFHPLFIGGNPMRSSGVLSLISYLEREYGVHYAIGGTHSLVKGHCRVDRKGQGGVIRTNAEVAEITVENGRATGVRLGGGQSHSGFDRGFQCRCRLDLFETACQTSAQALDRRQDRSCQILHEPVRLVFRGEPPKYEDVPHHTVMMGPRFGGLLHDIFDAKHLADDFSLYLYRPTGHR
jgi:phytoene desaturase